MKWFVCFCTACVLQPIWRRRCQLQQYSNVSAHTHTFSLYSAFADLFCKLFHMICFSRSSSYPYTDSTLYTQTTPVTYYETPPTSGSQVTSPSTPHVVSVTSGTGSMFSEGSSGITVSAGGSSSGMGVVTPGGVGSYVIQGGYMLGGGNQSFGHNTRASPATVSMILFIIFLSVCLYVCLTVCLSLTGAVADG